MKLLEMEKDMKIKHSASSPPPIRYGGTFSEKELSMGQKTFFGKIYGGMFFIGTNDQIMQRGKLMVKRFQSSSQVSFALIDPDLGYLYM